MKQGIGHILPPHPYLIAYYQIYPLAFFIHPFHFACNKEKRCSLSLSVT